MQSIIAFVLLLSLRTVTLAADVIVYYDLDYKESFPDLVVGNIQCTVLTPTTLLYEANAEPGNETKPIEVSQFPWKFSYHSDDTRLIRIFWKNKSPSVTTVNVTIGTESRTYPAKNHTVSYGTRIGEEYYEVIFDRYLKPTKMKLNLYSSNMLCASLFVAEGRQVTTIPNKKKAQYYDISRECGYALVVDLIKQCGDLPLVTGTTMSTTTDITSNNNSSTDLEITTNKNSAIDTNLPLVTGTTMSTTTDITSNNNSSTDLKITTNKNSAIDTKNAEQPQNLLLYVMIPSVIGTSAVILVIYLLRKKKNCHRSSPPADTMELNTYATANEVVYADLSFVNGDSQPPRRDEQSPYAEIIGFIKPIAGDVNNK